MTTLEALEVRAAFAEILDPLLAGRAGTIPAREAIERAITIAQRRDDAGRTALYLGQVAERAGT